MEESLRNALSELKRAEHSLFVSLKYTRTVDVIKHIVERLRPDIDNGTGPRNFKQRFQNCLLPVLEGKQTLR